jgi:hypothetical protein
MARQSTASRLAWASAIAAGIAAAGYAGLVAWHRWHYGRPRRPADAGPAALLDQFMPEPEVIEHHWIKVDAPAETVLATARSMRALDQPLVRAIIKMREWALGGHADNRPHPRALLAQMQSIGWVILAESAGREVVLGAVTRPWEAAPVFRSIPAADFKAFAEPGYVKILWTLRADPIGETSSIFRTETRVSTTDDAARERFRRYWSFVAPGVGVIRLAILHPLKRQAERRHRRPAA